MSTSINFNDILDNGSIRDIRDALMFTCDGSTEFSRRINLATHTDGVFEPHDGVAFETNRDNWSKEYGHSLGRAMSHNFSVERLRHINDVVNHQTNNRQPSIINQIIGGVIVTAVVGAIGYGIYRLFR